MKHALRVKELRNKINNGLDQIAFYYSVISILMHEQNLRDLEIEEYETRKVEALKELRDLRAELEDTV